MNEFKFLFSRMPFQIIFYPTSRCNAFCSHCYNYHREVETSKDVELSLEEIDKITRKLGHVKALTVSGGEPFLRTALKEIVQLFYENSGVRYVSLHTHGYFTKRVVETVRALMEELDGLTLILCTSIDGPQKLHDEIRGVPRGFDRMVETIKQIEEMKAEFPKLFILSSTIFSASTQKNYFETIGFVRREFKTVKPSACFIRGEAKDLKEKEVDHSFYEEYLSYCQNNVDRTVKLFSAMALKETLESMVAQVVLNNHLEQRQTVPCQAGRKLLVIYENGSVYPCETLKENFGNLRDVDYDINQLLFSNKGHELKRKINPGMECNCTWENAITPSLLYDVKSYPRIAYNWFRLFVLGDRSRVDRSLTSTPARRSSRDRGAGRPLPSPSVR